jgi:hypothetical protein
MGLDVRPQHGGSDMSGFLPIHRAGTTLEALLLAVVATVVFALILFYGFTSPTVEPGAFLNNPNLAP